MNICFVDYDFTKSGGIEKVLSGLAIGLSDTYMVFAVSICAQNGKPYFPLDSRVKTAVINQKDGRLRTIAAHSVRPLLSFFKQNRIDVCLVLGHYPVPAILPVLPFVKTKFIFCDHGALINQWDDKKARLFRRLAAKFFDKVITLTQRNRDDYIKFFRIKSEKIGFIYNPVELPAQKRGYDPDSKKIITAARFSEEKGLDLLVKVAKKVFDRFPDWSWDVYGDGELLPQISRQAQDAGLEKNLFFKGVSSRLQQIYPDYAMYVMTSYREGLPLVLLEAQAGGLPVVSFDCATGPAEIVSQGENGFLIPCYDTDMMAQKICQLIEDASLRARFAEQSGRDLEKFQTDAVLRQWQETINKFSRRDGAVKEKV